MVKEIFFHYSEFKGDLEALQAGDDVEFTIKDRNVSATFLGISVERFENVSLSFSSTFDCLCVTLKGL